MHFLTNANNYTQINFQIARLTFSQRFSLSSIQREQEIFFRVSALVALGIHGVMASLQPAHFTIITP